MSLTINPLASAVALVGSGSQTSASFTPSNNSLLVVIWEPHDYAGASSTFKDTLTITDSLGTSLAYSARVSEHSYGDDHNRALQIWTAPVTTGAPMTITCDSSVYLGACNLDVVEVVSSTGEIPLVTQAKGVYQSSIDNGAYSFDLDESPSADSLLFAFLFWSHYGSVASSVVEGSGWTELNDFCHDAGEIVSHAQSRTGTTSPTIAWADISTRASNLPTYTIAAALELSEPVSAPLEQEGFRFGYDDATESAHTWRDDQDADVSIPLGENVLLRVLVDATGDPGNTAYTLRVQKNGAGGYLPVPVGSSGPGTTPLIEAGDAVPTTVGTAAGTWNVDFPAASAGDLLVAVLTWDDSTTVSSVTPPAGPNSESASSIVGPQESASTEIRMQAWRWVAAGSWSSGTRAFTPSASETCRAVVFRVPAGEFDAATPIGAFGGASSAGTAESTVNSPAFAAGASDGGGRLVLCFGSDADAITAPASGTSTVNNATGGGVGLCVVTRDAAVANSESIAAIAASIASDSWASLGFVIRAPIVTNGLYVATSANIAAGGEATTARLTAPSGKTTGNFTTGRRWDDENGADSIDIEEDEYTEVEWCLRAQSPTAQSDYFEFRVYAGSSALDTYTVTPKATVATLKQLQITGLHADAVGATNVSGIVFAAPTEGEITGAEIGEFTGASIEADGENAKLVVDVTEFGGSALSVGSGPVVLLRTSTHTTGLIVSGVSVIEE